MNLLLAFVIVWAVIDQWPFRGLAWLWLITVSLPFLVMVLVVWSVITGCKGIAAKLSRLRDAVVTQSIAEDS